VFNIQKAVSRLEYAPRLSEIEVTDIKKGLGVFTPKPDKPVSFASLKNNLKQAGYVLASADITVIGKLSNESGKWFLVTDTSGQRFTLEGREVTAVLNKSDNKASVEITGLWSTVGKGSGSYEAIDPVNVTPKYADVKETVGFHFLRASFGPIGSDDAFDGSEPEAKPPAPIRTTSPGLTVFKGGAFTPRIYFIKQHLANLNVRRQLIDLNFSYTPSPHVQLELEVPFSRTSFDDSVRSGSAVGLGNIMLWAKYRFFRVVKTYGDRQASARLGLELPTGKSNAPTAAQVNAPAYVRQQLTPINGGFAPHFDVSFSQAGGRFIFGGNAEGIYRTERDGFRIGHELRLNTDLEYVLFPRHYHKPGGELFAILESSFITRGKGRLNSTVAPGSSSTEYYLSPGLQYAAKPQFVVEGSIQLPVFRRDGSQVIRTDYNLLLGVRYLF
jgi:Putative MetA-pathway of phenol degradation